MGKCWLHKHDDLSLDPQHPHNTLGVEVSTCNPSWERDRESLELSG